MLQAVFESSLGISPPCLGPKPLQASSLSVNHNLMLVGTLFNLLCDFYGCFLYLLFIKLCQALIFFPPKK